MACVLGAVAGRLSDKSQIVHDWSAGGGADWHTAMTERARASGGLGAAEASPRRCCQTPPLRHSCSRRLSHRTRSRGVTACISVWHGAPSTLRLIGRAPWKHGAPPWRNSNISDSPGLSGKMPSYCPAYGDRNSTIVQQEYQVSGGSTFSHEILPVAETHHPLTGHVPFSADARWPSLHGLVGCLLCLATTPPALM